MAEAGIRAGTPAASSFVRDRLPERPKKVPRDVLQKGVNLVEAGRSGQALTRARGAVGDISKLAAQYRDRVLHVVGGTKPDPITRVVQRIAPDPMRSPEGRAQDVNTARNELLAGASQRIAEAAADLNVVRELHAPIPRLGVDPALPEARSGELQALLQLALAGSFAQWRGLAQAAVDSEDLPRADLLAFACRARADSWAGAVGGGRETIESDLATLDDLFAKPPVVASRYAQLVTGALLQGLKLMEIMFQQPDGFDQLAMGMNTGRWRAFRGPAADETPEEFWDAIHAAAISPETSPWVLQRDGSLVGTQRSSEAAGPLRSAADAGSRGT